MKELRKKTFLTIFAILSLILLTGLVIVNAQNYNRERESIKKNLNVLDDRSRRPDEKKRSFTIKGVNRDKDGDGEPRGFDPEQMMIMDHEVYTVELSDGVITKIVSHGNASGDFDVQSVAEKIMQDSDPGREEIGNLFFAAYSYNYSQNGRIVIINNKEVATGCRRYLLVSLLLLVLFEMLLVLISRLITGWIVKPAQESFRKQREFIADASHELKTPLAVIMASAEELGRSGDNSEENRSRLITNISYESDRMNRLIAQLLNLSRLDENRETSRAEEDLSRLTRKTVSAFEAVAFEQWVMIETDIQDNVRFKCNRDEMEKMLSTILDNAVRHSYKETSVLVGLKEHKGHILIRIENRGDPIPEGDETRIFERFYRGDVSRSRQENRYGLGLAIAKSIAENHHGDIKARSSDGKTIFEISLKASR